MLRGLRLILASILIVGLAFAAAADDRDAWSIVQKAGQIWIKSPGAQAAALGDARTLASGATLATGANGRVLLQRGKETMIVGPNTIMRLPRGASRFYTTVHELMGEIEFDVEARNVRHFEVRTPLLAAVVKGTHFIVRAERGVDTVLVTRGRVEVEAAETGETVHLTAGQKVEVSGSGMSVFEGDRADLGPGGTETAAGAPLGGAAGGITNGAGSAGLSLGLGGSNGVSVSAGGGGVSASVGGSSGVSASVGGGGGVSASVGGSGGVSASVGGGSGVSVSVGGLSIAAP